jgi:hypothetical protein
LLDKEALIEDIRNKSQELMKTKKGVPGMERIHQQFADLGNIFYSCVSGFTVLLV